MAAQRRDPDPCVVVIFGASGDLTSRKLLPALFNLRREGLVPDSTCVLGTARTKMTDEEFATRMREAGEEHSRVTPDDDSWGSFADNLFYVAGDLTSEETYRALEQKLEQIDERHGTGGNRGW